jgi:putative peptidoglycan lipid II flippase
MVRRVVSLLYREIRSLHQAAYLLASFALISQLLALLRDRLLAHTFGAGETLDVYYAAFRFPDFIFVATASLVSVYVLIPFLEAKMKEGDIRSFINTVFSFFSILITGLAAVAFVFTPVLVRTVFPGFDESSYETLTMLTRIMLLQPFLLGISNLFASITQVYQRFVLYAASPILYNLGIIAGIAVLVPLFGVAGLAWGVVLGAILHLVIQIPFIVRERLLPSFTWPRMDVVAPIIRTSIPRTAALSMQQLVILVFTSIASFFAAGSIAVFALAYNLQSVPLAVIGMSYSVAAFPTLAKYISEGQRDRFINQVSVAARHIFFWSLPAMALFIVLRAHIVRVVLGSGAFDWVDTRLTTAALGLFVLSLAAQALTLLLARAFYATGNTRVPFWSAVGVSSAAISLGYLLALAYPHSEFLHALFAVFLRGENLPGEIVLTLPLAFSLSVIFQAGLLVYFFETHHGGLVRKTSAAFLNGLVAALAAGLSSYLYLMVLEAFFEPTDTFWSIFGQGFLSGTVGIIAGIAALMALKSDELTEVWTTLRRKIWRADVVVSDVQ